MKSYRFCLSLLALILTTLLSLTGLADGDLDPGFVPRLIKAGVVRAIQVQPDGKILIGGDFKAINGVPRYGIARLNPDGSLDATFDLSEAAVMFRVGSSGVTNLALQSDGRILVAHQDFSSPSTPMIFRLNADGSVDRQFRYPFYVDHWFTFEIVSQPDGKILYPTSGGGIARVNSDGSPDSSFKFGGPVLGAGGAPVSGIIMLQADGKILVNSAVNNPNGTSLRNFLRLNRDGSRDTSFDPGKGLDGPGALYDIAIQSDGKIIATGGNFFYYNGTYVGNTFRVNPDGSLDPSFSPPVTGIRQLLIQPDNRIVAAGEFIGYTGIPRKNIMRLNPDGSLDTSFDPGLGIIGPTHALARQSDGKILVGGEFILANQEVRPGLVRILDDGRIDSGFKPVIAGRTEVYSANLAPGGRIVIAGNFDLVGEAVQPKLARLNADGTLDKGFAPSTVDLAPRDERFRKIAVQPDGKVLIYTDFLHRVERLNADGSLESSLITPSLSSFSGVLELQADGKILVSGTIGSFPDVYLIRLNPNGTEDTTFKPPARLVAKAMALEPDGKIIVLGTRVPAPVIDSPVIVRLNVDGTQDSSFQPDVAADRTVRAIALQPDGKLLVGGDKRVADGSLQRFVLRLNNDGSADPSFTTNNLGPNTPDTSANFIRLLTVERSGKVLVVINSNNGIVRLNPNGSSDSSLNLKLYPLTQEVGETIDFLLAQPDDQLLVGGAFDRIGFPPGQPRFSLARFRSGEASIVTTVSAASYFGMVAPVSIASSFGTGIAGSAGAAMTRPLPETLDGIAVKIKDSAGLERIAPLFFISPTQINFLVPDSTAPGIAMLTIELNGIKLGAGTVNIAGIAPGFFTFNGNGNGVPAGYALRVRGSAQTNEPIHQLAPSGEPTQFLPKPIDLGPEGDQVWLVIFGTGIRGRTALSNVTATIGGVNAMVGYAGAQGSLFGLDQVNLLIPRSLAGRGEVDLLLTVDGRTTRVVKLNIK